MGEIRETAAARGFGLGRGHNLSESWGLYINLVAGSCGILENHKHVLCCDWGANIVKNGNKMLQNKYNCTDNTQ